MQRWLQKILLFIPVVTIIGHSFLPHHHPEEIQEVARNHHHEKQHPKANHHQHDENKKDGHDIFAFSQLDESFVRGKVQNVSFELPFLYLITHTVTLQYTLIREESKTNFGYYKEYPPPGNYLSKFPSRGPPTNSSMV